LSQFIFLIVLGFLLRGARLICGERSNFGRRANVLASFSSFTGPTFQNRPEFLLEAADEAFAEAGRVYAHGQALRDSQCLSDVLALPLQLKVRQPSRISVLHPRRRVYGQEVLRRCVHSD
jgi:hypothetical protein